MTGRPIPTEHGTTGYYQYWGCKCEPCRKAMAQYRKRHDFELAQGRSRRAEVGPIREHLQRLVDNGATPCSIAKQTNGAATHVQVTRILDGSTKAYVLRKAADALMAVEHAEAEWLMVSTVGLRRRVQALHAIGHTKDDIGAVMGHTGSFICDLCSHDEVMISSLNKVKHAYDVLVGTAGTSELQRWRAIRAGWAPPMAWDDADLDNPEAEPHWEWVRCAGPKCHNHVHKAGLCNFHFHKLRRLGVFEQEPKHFRQAVLKHCSHAVNANSSLMQDLGELKAQGVSPSHAARQLGRGVTYVEKIWSKA